MNSLGLHNFETITKYTIWFSLEQVFTLIGRNVGYGGENIGTVSDHSRVIRQQIATSAQSLHHDGPCNRWHYHGQLHDEDQVSCEVPYGCGL